jgi:hypothetical protein
MPGPLRLLWLLPLAVGLMAGDSAGVRRESFDRNPQWEGRNNRSTAFAPRKVVQDFGYSRTAHAGSGRGEIGGFISPAAEPAYYSRRIAPRSLGDRLTASGTLACTGRQFHVLIGFFNAGTLNEWRTPNTIALRLLGRGDRFFAFVEYATSRWRAGGDSPGGFAVVPDPETGRPQLAGFLAGDRSHTWSLAYDPGGNGGNGVVTATIDTETAVCHLSPGHKADGATFNRFGLLNVMKSADDGGEVWLDDVTVLGATERFDHDPGWEGLRNRRTYLSTNVRPRFDFGYSPTRHAGGRRAGELGGQTFRGDCRYPERMACYGDRLERLDLSKPLRASGRVCLRRGVSDSTTLLGFYHSTESMAVTASQSAGLPRSFLGVAIEGPSRDGFFFYPAYRLGEDNPQSRLKSRPPPIYPNGRPHDWTLNYLPDAAGGRGQIRVTLDSESVSVTLEAGEKNNGARFDRFGIVTPWIDGNGQEIYFDDLEYTCRQE